MSKSPLFILLSSIAAGLISGWIAWGGNEVQPAVFFVFGFATVLGFLNPKLMPVSAVLVGSEVPAFYFLSAALGYPTRFVPEPNTWASFVAVIPALVGGTLGAGIRLGMKVLNSA
jgi:hypothetical protein